MNLSFSPISFDDVDLFSDWEVGLGWDIESTQLSFGANEIGFDHFAFPELLVGHFHSRRSMHNVFEVPDGIMVFLICRTKQPAVWCGREFPPSLLSIVRPGRTHWAVLPENWNCYEFMVSEELIRRTEIFPPEFYAKTTRFEHALLPLVEPLTERFLERMDFFFSEGQKRQWIARSRSLQSRVLRFHHSRSTASDRRRACRQRFSITQTCQAS